MLKWLFVMLSITVFGGFMSANDALAVDRSALMAYWSFNKGSGQTVADDSGNGHEGKIMDADWAKEGKINSGMSFSSRILSCRLPTLSDMPHGLNSRLSLS